MVRIMVGVVSRQRGPPTSLRRSECRGGDHHGGGVCVVYSASVGGGGVGGNGACWMATGRSGNSGSSDGTSRVRTACVGGGDNQSSTTTCGGVVTTWMGDYLRSVGNHPRSNSLQPQPRRRRRRRRRRPATACDHLQPPAYEPWVIVTLQLRWQPSGVRLSVRDDNYLRSYGGNRKPRPPEWTAATCVLLRDLGGLDGATGSDHGGPDARLGGLEAFVTIAGVLATDRLAGDHCRGLPDLDHRAAEVDLGDGLGRLRGCGGLGRRCGRGRLGWRGGLCCGDGAGGPAG